MDGRRFRELLNSFVTSNYNIIVVFNPHCKEETQRVILFSSYTCPRQGIFEYTIKGQDITDLVEDLKVNSFEIPGKVDLGLSTKIDSISSYTYIFSQDYSMELIRN